MLPLKSWKFFVKTLAKMSSFAWMWKKISVIWNNLCETENCIIRQMIKCDRQYDNFILLNLFLHHQTQLFCSLYIFTSFSLLMSEYKIDWCLLNRVLYLFNHTKQHTIYRRKLYLPVFPCRHLKIRRAVVRNRLFWSPFSSVKYFLQQDVYERSI
jgi:hypothetical protein